MAAPVITVAGGGGAAGPISAACPGGGATPSMGAMSVQDLTCATFSATAPTVGSVAGFGPSGSTLTATAAVTSQNPTGAATATFADSSCTGGSVSIAPAAGTCTTAGSATAAAGTGNLSAIVFPTGCTGLTSATQTFIVTGAGFVACGGSTTKVIAGRAVSETVHVTVTGAGSGYSAATNVSLSAGPTACTGGAITFELLSISPATGCEGYNAPPTVSLGGGTASATATLTPQVAFTQIAAGSGYSVSPNLPTITLSGGGGGGTCTGMGTGGVVGAGGGNATIGGGGITSISNATNCSGFNSNPTVSIAGGATATAIASNEAAIAAPIQNNGVVLKYVACNGSDIAASTGSTTFATFTLAAPTFAASPDQDSRTILNLGSTLTVSTTSTFADEFINWTTDGTAPVCASAGTGGTITGASGTIPATALTLATTSVKAIACGTNQLPSNVATSGFTSVAVAAP
jgi:fibronectin-binding autotransporter adhesin